MNLFTNRSTESFPNWLGENGNPLALQSTLSSTHFEKFAAALVGKVYDLLQTPVLVATDNGRILVASQSHWEGMYLQTFDGDFLPSCIRIPLALDKEANEGGQLLIYYQEADETFAELAEKIVRLSIDQILLTEQLPDYHKLKDKFIYNLLCGYITDETLIELHAQQLGLDLAPPRAVILVDASDYILPSSADSHATVRYNYLEVEKRVQSVTNSIADFFTLPNRTICAYMGQGEIAILKATDTKNLDSWADDEVTVQTPSWANLHALKRATDLLLTALKETLPASYTIGIGRHHPGLTGLSRSYEDAQAALSLGRRFYGANRVHCLDELGIASFAGIADERIKSELAAHILSPLDSDEKLISTLQVFFDNNCSPSQTASALSIHRNTLNYRLDKITSLIGLDPRQFDDAVQIRLALLLRSPVKISS